MAPNTTPSDPHGFHPEIRQIEQGIIAFFAEKMPEYTGRHPIIATVMAYFFTRRTLTQEDLQNLTGFSAGTISNSVRQLAKMDFITKEFIPRTHKHIYKMEQLPFRSPRYFLKTELFLETLKKELEEMKATLDTQPEETRHLEGYQTVHSIITQLLGLLSRVPVLMALIEKELNQYINEDNDMR